MNKRVRALQPALDSAQADTRRALKTLLDAQRRLAEHLALIGQLEKYRDEYFDKLNGRLQGTDGGSLLPRQLQDYTVFLVNLERRVRQAYADSPALELACARAQERWRHSHSRQQGLAVVIDGQRREQARSEARREQTESDEWAAQIVCGARVFDTS